MKKIALVLGLLCSSSVFANSHKFQMIYKGQGIWKNSQSQNGTHEILIEKTQHDDGTSTVRAMIDTSDGKHISCNMAMRPNADESVSVYDDAGANIGWGYCFPLEKGFICHANLNPSEGVTVEKTVHATLDTVSSVGSISDSNGRTWWKDTARRIYPVEAGNNTAE